jgi:hypothetical protein
VAEFTERRRGVEVAEALRLGDFRRWKGSAGGQGNSGEVLWLGEEGIGVRSPWDEATTAGGGGVTPDGERSGVWQAAAVSLCRVLRQGRVHNIVFKAIRRGMATDPLFTF